MKAQRKFRTGKPQLSWWLMPEIEEEYFVKTGMIAAAAETFKSSPPKNPLAKGKEDVKKDDSSATTKSHQPSPNSSHPRSLHMLLPMSLQFSKCIKRFLKVRVRCRAPRARTSNYLHTFRRRVKKPVSRCHRISALRDLFRKSKVFINYQ